MLTNYARWQTSIAAKAMQDEEELAAQLNDYGDKDWDDPPEVSASTSEAPHTAPAPSRPRHAATWPPSRGRLIK